MANRTTLQRREDVVRRLETDPNVWVATASDGLPHHVPLSLAWDGSRILVATPTDSPTVRNAVGSGQARASLDSAVEVAIFECTVEAVPFADLQAQDLQTFVQRVGWNPASNEGVWSLLYLTPLRVLAWNNVSEITGRTIMRDGAWLA